jgi:hypothetical protein
MAMRGSSLRDKQIASLKKILNLNEDVDSAEHEDTQANGLSNSPIAWKVLVFDDLGQEYESLLPQSCPGTHVLITGSTVSSALF